MVNRLREIREDQNISQIKLAELSGVSRPTIIKIEQGKGVDVKTSTLIRIAEALNTTVSCIFFN